jgi:CheY-like chemotaxis protein
MGAGIRSVLVVDDDEDIRDVLTDMLRESGYGVEVAKDGAAALATMKVHRPALVVLDLMMPNVDGWHVMSEMDRDPMLRSIPVCVLSGCGQQAPAQAACVLEKPIMTLPLLRVIERYCGPPPPPHVE